MQLTQTEKSAIAGIIARQEAAFQQYIAPLQNELGEVFTEIAVRLDLPPDAFNTTHLLNLDTGQVLPREDVPQGDPVGKPDPVPVGEYPAEAFQAG